MRTKPKTKKKNNKRKTSAKPTNSNKNAEAQWNVYKELKAATDKAWNKLKKDIYRKAPIETLTKDRNELGLLLGECNYMTLEYSRMEARNKTNRNK